MVDVIQDFFSSGTMPRGLNHTFIALIPKGEGSSRLSQFRPISLCNVVYKAISKIMTNRPKKVLPKIVSSNQGAFVPGRKLHHQAILAQELVHVLHKSKARDGYVAVKVDMRQAYDRIEWVFIEETLKKLGFHSTFIGWIMECVTTPTFSTLINGEPSQSFKSSRGLRQGDPLSPLLYVLGMDVFSRYLLDLASRNTIRGIKVDRVATPVTHLLYADDCILFLKNATGVIKRASKALNLFCRASGQLVNFTKSHSYFSPHAPAWLKRRHGRILGMNEGTFPFKYLGIPLKVGCLNKEDCRPLVDRFSGRLQGWKSNFLSIQ